MSTKAEQFRYLAERSGPKRPKQPPRAAPAPAEGMHRESLRAGKKAQYALESSQGRPSRKSTRAAANRQKNDVQFRMKRQTHEVRPEDRPRPPSR